MYIIIGGSGFLGRYCIRSILNSTQETIVATYSKTKPSFVHDRITWLKLDVTDFTAVNEFAQTYGASSKVIYLASFHHPDEVERFPQKAWDINIVALANCVNAFKRALCFYYSSTDSVYGEGSIYERYRENHKLSPVNLYGKHKKLAEEICLVAGSNIIRYPFIFGASLVENRLHFFDKIKIALQRGESVEMFNDSYRSTLSFKQCADFLIRLIERYGACDEKVINISGDDILSKYDVALKLAKKYNLNIELIKQVSINDSANIFSAKRATTCILDNSKFKNLMSIKVIHMEI